MDRSPRDSQSAGHIAVEGRAGVLVARIDGGQHALFDAEIAQQVKELVDRADRDPDIHAVVFTGTHPDRFLSHSDVGLNPVSMIRGPVLPGVRNGRSRDTLSDHASPRPSAVYGVVLHDAPGPGEEAVGQADVAAGGPASDDGWGAGEAGQV